MVTVARGSSLVERAVRRDRAVVVGALAAVTLIAWAALARMAVSMGASAADRQMHAAMGMPEMAAWGLAEFIMLFLMWTVMMVAMMLPSAAPVILLVVGTYQRRGERARVLPLTFASGYLIVWTAFGLAAAAAQLFLHRAALLSEAMTSTSALLGGAVLIGAGIYQWLPIKAACLSHCRSPLAFLVREWREGARGALVMGARHGLYCVGCCWAVMLVLFAAGVMNLLWVAALSALVLVEKLSPYGAALGRAAGLGLVAWGIRMLAAAL